MAQTRAAIIGTAQSWSLTPWNDPSCYLVSLNDAYRLKGFVRADAWYDLHPLNKFFHPVAGQPIYAHQVPLGHYARPIEHKEWLAKQVIPVWLHPEHVTQDPASATWPSARAFPRAEIEAHFGRYFTSSPAWMLAHLMTQGYQEIHIYGIHLATEHEYREQRPQMEFLAGRFLGRGKLAMSVKDGLRHYETPDAHLVLPEASPVLQQGWQYAFEPKPVRANTELLKWDLHRYNVKRERTIAALKTAPWWQSTKALQHDLWRFEAYQQDVQEQLARVDLAERWV